MTIDANLIIGLQIGSAFGFIAGVGLVFVVLIFHRADKYVEKNRTSVTLTRY